MPGIPSHSDPRKEHCPSPSWFPSCFRASVGSRTEGAMGGDDGVEGHREELQRDEPQYHRRIDFQLH
jgi:hypothetical protein